MAGPLIRKLSAAPTRTLFDRHAPTKGTDHALHLHRFLRAARFRVAHRRHHRRRGARLGQPSYVAGPWQIRGTPAGASTSWLASSADHGTAHVSRMVRHCVKPRTWRTDTAAPPSSNSTHRMAGAKRSTQSHLKEHEAMATVITTAVATAAGNGYVGSVWVRGYRVAVAVGADAYTARLAAVRAYRRGRA